ncbi:MAG TPA: ABC transporter substrate-binding protein [Acidimicrobiia bacterium]|nr:ABC transporter substrate-binding protein [Acidimicrobiia bacterium]
MRTRPKSGLLALLAALALVVAACDGGTADTTEPEAGTTEAPTDTTAAPTDTTAAPTDTTAAPSGEPIKIGQLSDLTSTFTPWGVNVRDGMALAAQEINDGGGVDGRMIEIVVEDSENNGEVAATAWDRLIEEGVVAVGGILSSGVSPTVGPLAETDQVPVFYVKAGTESPDALNQESRYTFRTCLPSAPMTPGPVVQYVTEQGITNVGVIIADYPWGQSFGAAVGPALEAAGVDYGDIQVAPVPPDTDFTPFVRAMGDAGAQMVIATGHPPGNAAILTATTDLIGEDIPVTGAWTPPDLVVGGLQELAIGRYSDFSCADYTSDSYADLAARYLEFSDNGFMSDDAVAGYAIVSMVAEAVGEVGDDPTAIAEYIHGTEFDMPGYAHPLAWTEWGELSQSQPTFFQITEGPAPEGLNDAGEWWVELLSQSDPLEPYVPGS